MTNWGEEKNRKKLRRLKIKLKGKSWCVKKLRKMIERKWVNNKNHNRSRRKKRGFCREKKKTRKENRQSWETENKDRTRIGLRERTKEKLMSKKSDVRNNKGNWISAKDKKIGFKNKNKENNYSKEMLSQEKDKKKW